jgi:hypothetical protein
MMNVEIFFLELMFSCATASGVPDRQGTYGLCGLATLTEGSIF